MVAEGMEEGTRLGVWVKISVGVFDAAGLGVAVGDAVKVEVDTFGTQSVRPGRIKSPCRQFTCFRYQVEIR